MNSKAHEKFSKKELAIRAVKARIIYNSRGEETIEVDVYLQNVLGRSSAPSGASVGKHEAVSFPPGGPRASIEALSKILHKIVGQDASNYRMINSVLREADRRENYSKVGGSSAFALTMASLDAASKAKEMAAFELLGSGPFSLPIPLGNVLGGGRHAGRGAPDVQEFLACPLGARNIREALKANIEVHREVKRILDLKDSSFTGGKGDEGAWAPRMNNEEAADVVSEAIRVVNNRTGLKIRMGLDIASSSLWNPKEGKYVYPTEDVKREPLEQLGFVKKLIETYDLLYVEDPLHEEAFEETADLTKSVKGVLISGDDLFATSKRRLERGSRLGAGNSAILKVNQAGGLADAWNFVEFAQRSGYKLITSHRSGDVPESIIVHVAIASKSKFIKAGVMGGERISKLNELIRIEESHGLPLSSIFLGNP